MARKFKEGDTVQVVKCANPGEFPFSPLFKMGHRGMVTDYDRDNIPHCYEVQRKNGELSCFTATELKLIKRKGD